jgi:hypothetical protein
MNKILPLCFLPQSSTHANGCSGLNKNLSSFYIVVQFISTARSLAGYFSFPAGIVYDKRTGKGRSGKKHGTYIHSSFTAFFTTGMEKFNV